MLLRSRRAAAAGTASAPGRRESWPGENRITRVRSASRMISVSSVPERMRSRRRSAAALVDERLGEVDPAHVEVGHLVGERPAEGPDAGLHGAGRIARIAGGAGADHPEPGLAAAEMLDAALQAEAALAQAVCRRAGMVEGAGEEHHRIGGLTLQFEQRLLRIEDDRDVDAARHQQGRQRRGRLRREGVVRADDEGEGLPGGRLGAAPGPRR